MTSDCLKLNVYFGESDRIEGRLLSDELLDLFEEHSLQAAVLMRAIEGFGIKQMLRTDRFLTLSEDLPLVAIGIDERSSIEALLPRVRELVVGGLITLERARLLRGELGPAALPEADHEETKLTLYLGRDERVSGRPAYLAVVDHLRRHGLSGATVLLGVDGITRRRRQRARFFSQNAAVPLMLISVGSGAAVAASLEGLGQLVADPIATLERVRVCKRDGRLYAEPQHVPPGDGAGRGMWQKLMVYAAERDLHDGLPLHLQLIRRLHAERASGATVLRGVWGFSGDHPPHGDRLLALRRQVPVVTTIVDAPDQIRRWFGIVDDLTNAAGLVTSELVPAFLAVGPEASIGALELGGDETGPTEPAPR